MRIKLSELRRIIRETIEESTIDEASVDQSAFSFLVAKAAEDGEETVDVGGKKYPVKMSKEKAKKITGKKQDK